MLSDLTANSHTVVSTLKSRRTNSTKHSERVGRCACRTATGPDTVRYSGIKNLKEADMTELCTIYQENLDKGHFPDDGTKVFLIPIPKPRKDHHRKLNRSIDTTFLQCRTQSESS